MTKGEAAKQAARAIETYRQQIDDISQERQRVEAERERITAEVERVRSELCERLLPSADPATLERVASACRAPFLTTERFRHEGLRGERSQRLEEIRTDPDFQERGSGVLADEVERLGAHERELMVSLAVFDVAPFRWLLQQQASEHQGGFHSFWRAVTFASHREKKAHEALTAQLGYPSWDALWANYQKLSSELPETRKALAEQRSRYEKLQKTIVEHDDLNLWVNHFEERLLTDLRQRLSTSLADAKPSEVYAQVPPEAHASASHLAGLSFQATYLSELSAFLDGQRKERAERVASIDRVRQLWERNRYDRLSGDKSGWLVDGPAALTQSTAKRLRWSRALCANLGGYSSWDSYARYCEAGFEFLPYDAFAWGCDAPMPTEKFTRSLFPGLDWYRHAHGQNGPDYSDFKRIDKSDRSVPVSPDESDDDTTLLTAAAVGTAVVTTAVLLHEAS